MKKLLFVLLIFPFAAFAQKGFVITGKIDGVENKTPITLVNADKQEDTASKTTVVNGTFTLKGNVKSPYLYMLFIGNSTPAKRIVVFLDNSKINITGNVNDLEKIAVTGSPSHDDFVVFQKQFNPLFKEISQLGQQVQAQGLSRDSAEVMRDRMLSNLSANADEYIKKRPTSYVSAFVAMVAVQFSETIAPTENRYAMLDPKVQKSTFGTMVKEKIEDSRVGAIGSQAIEFTQKDTSGKVVTLSNFKGKYVLLDFWASWCGPCRMENPNVVNAYNQFSKKNFTVLGVSLDKNHEAWVKAINADNLVWTNVSDLKQWQNEVALKYKVSAIPRNFLIGPDGTIVARDLRGQALEDKLCELLGCDK